MIQIKTLSQSLGKPLGQPIAQQTPQPTHGFIVPPWTWNGRAVSITEFANLAYGNTPQRTLFLLKYGDTK